MKKVILTLVLIGQGCFGAVPLKLLEDPVALRSRFATFTEEEQIFVLRQIQLLESVTSIRQLTRNELESRARYLEIVHDALSLPAEGEPRQTLYLAQFALFILARANWDLWQDNNPQTPFFTFVNQLRELGENADRREYLTQQPSSRALTEAVFVDIARSGSEEKTAERRAYLTRAIDIPTPRTPTFFDYYKAFFGLQAAPVASIPFSALVPSKTDWEVLLVGARYLPERDSFRAMTFDKALATFFNPENPYELRTVAQFYLWTDFDRNGSQAETRLLHFLSARALTPDFLDSVYELSLHRANNGLINRLLNTIRHDADLALVYKLVIGTLEHVSEHGFVFRRESYEKLQKMLVRLTDEELSAPDRNQLTIVVQDFVRSTKPITLNYQTTHQKKGLLDEYSVRLIREGGNRRLAGLVGLRIRLGHPCISGLLLELLKIDPQAESP